MSILGHKVLILYSKVKPGIKMLDIHYYIGNKYKHVMITVLKDIQLVKFNKSIVKEGIPLFIINDLTVSPLNQVIVPIETFIKILEDYMLLIKPMAGYC